MKEEYLQKKKASTSRELTLPKAVQHKMENAFGYDLSSIQMKETGYASEIGMRAYAQGNKVNFAKGQFNPLTASGQHLIGHEITHVIQQSKGQVRGDTTIGGETANLSNKLEHQADYVGGRIKNLQDTYSLENLPVLQTTGTGVIQGCGDKPVVVPATINLDIKPAVTHKKLGNIIKNLYKGQNSPKKIGNGTTMAAIRAELRTHTKTGGKFHETKGEESRQGLQNLVNGGQLTSEDEAVTKALIQDLDAALSGK